MKTNRQRKGILLLMACAFAFPGIVSSCKKKDDPKPQTTVIPTPSYPKFSDADATLIAVKATTPFPSNLPIPQIPGMPAGMDIEISFGMGVALFKNNAKADQVLLNGEELKFANGTHIWLPDYSNLSNPTAITGINLSGSINWKVTNPNIERTPGNTMPGTPKIASPVTVQKSAGYTLTHNSVSGASKILYTIADSQGKTVEKELAGTSTSCTFTAAELAGLGTSGTGIIQANAYRVTTETISGKKVYFINQSSYTISTAEIQ